MSNIPDLSAFQAQTPSRHSDTVARNVNLALQQYAEEGFEWEYIVTPFPTPQGVQFGSIFVMTMPIPVVGDTRRFLVSGQQPDLMTFHVLANVRQIVHDFVEQLRKMRSDFLKGTNGAQ